MEGVVVLAFTSALNPTLLTATTVMLLLDRPSRLMLGYWLGAMLTSLTCGIVIVFTLQDSSALGTTQHTLSPIADIALGALALVIAGVLATGRDRGVRERRAEKRKDAAPPRWLRTLQHGTPRTTFVIGALLTLPGASYVAGLVRLTKLDYSTAETVLVIIGFNLVMLILLEVPIIAFARAPERTAAAVDRVKLWAFTHGRRYGTWALAGIGVLLIVKGVIGALA